MEMSIEYGTSALLGGRGGIMTRAWNVSLLAIVRAAAITKHARRTYCSVGPAGRSQSQVQNVAKHMSLGIQAAGPPNA
jgi:hypothetical protein